MDRAKIRQDIENIICECDPDSNIDDEQLDLMIDKLVEYIVEI